MGAAPSRPEKTDSSSRLEIKYPSNSSRAGDGRAVPVAPSSATATSGTGTGSNQAQSKRASAPHMFREIVAQEENATELENQKYWVDEKTRCNCFMLFPRGLSITWGEDPRYWSWHPQKATRDTEEGIEVAFLKDVCWLEIHGKLELSHLTPGANYDVVFEVKLTEQAYGWSVPVILKLTLPDGTVHREQRENLQEKPRNQWLGLKVGDVKAEQGSKGQMDIALIGYINSPQWKSGLVLKAIKIVPKE